MFYQSGAPGCPSLPLGGLRWSDVNVVDVRRAGRDRFLLLEAENLTLWQNSFKYQDLVERQEDIREVGGHTFIDAPHSGRPTATVTSLKTSTQRPTNSGLRSA